MKKTVLGVCLFLGGLLSAGLWTVAEALIHLGGSGPLTWYLGGSDLPVFLLLAAMAVTGLAILVVQAFRERRRADRRLSGGARAQVAYA